MLSLLLGLSACSNEKRLTETKNQEALYSESRVQAQAGGVFTKNDHESAVELILDENKFSRGFYETQNTLFIRVASKASVTNQIKIKGASTLQVGMALLQYSKSKCSGLEKISLSIKGLSKKHAQFKDDRFVEIWSVPKVEIDEWIKATCKK